MKKPWINSYDNEVPTSLHYPYVPLTYFLSESARRFPSSPCMTFKDTQFSYEKTAKLVGALSRGLANIGIQKGDQVGLVIGNIPQFVISFYAILNIGGIVVAMNPQYKKRELLDQLSRSDCRYVITTSENYKLIKELQQETEIACVIVSHVSDYLVMADNISLVSKKELDCRDHDHSLIELIRQNYLDQLTDIQSSAEDPAIFQFSGGTTGTPKAAIGLHRNLVANTLQFRSWLFDLEEGKEVVLAAIPLYHVYGMVIAMSMGIALGANLVLIPDPRDIVDILGNIEKYRATLFPGVPNMYQAINRHPRVTEFDLESIKACISGSAPLLREVKEKFENLTGGKLLEGYGLSEAPTATHCNPYQGDNRTGSIGLPLPDVNCRLVSLEDGITEVGDGEAGELLIMSPQVMKGYYRLPEETEQTLVDGWLHTGDVARMDADGYFYLVDRKKDVIKASGFQVWPREVEEVISENDAVLEAAVAGVIDSQKGEIVYAWVVLQQGKTITEEALKKWCKERLANYKAPVKIEFVDHLPRTTVGKILRRELVQRYNRSEQSVK